MDKFEQECKRHHGIWHGETIGCILKEKIDGVEHLRHIYPTSKGQCINNGDLWMEGQSNKPFAGLMVCRELFLNEYCRSRGYLIETCLPKVNLPRKKIEDYIDHSIWSQDIYRFQKIPSDILDKSLKIFASEEISSASYNNLIILLRHQKLTEKQINFLINKWAKKENYFEPFNTLVEYQGLSPNNVNQMIEKVQKNTEVFEHLYSKIGKFLDDEQITLAIKNIASVDYLVLHARLKPPHISMILKNAIEIGDSAITHIIKRYKLNSEQIDSFFKIPGWSTFAIDLMNTQQLNKKHIWKIIKTEKISYINHLLKKFSVDYEIINWCINKLPDSYAALYEGQKSRIPNEQRDRILWHLLTKGEFDCMENPNKHFPKEIIDKYLNQIYQQEFGAEVKQIGLGEFVPGVPELKDETKEFREYYAKYGREPEHPVLHKLYEFLQLSPEQIDKALKIGYSVDQLFRYQKNLEPRHIDYAIRNNINLDNLVTSDRITREQRLVILEKMGFTKKDLAELGDILHHPLWKYVSPRRLMEAVRNYKQAVKEKTEDNPLRSLVGVYPKNEHPIEPIIMFLKKKRMHLKKGDIKYAYYIDHNNIERKIRLGKLLKRDRQLYTSWLHMMQYGVPPFEKTDVEIMLSNKPEDVAAKSTGWNANGMFHGSCETIGSSYGWGKSCGWCDDIKANNLIAVVKKPGENRNRWLGRSMIRWCIRHDDKKPDAIIEKYYGDGKYRPLLQSRVKNILESHGFSATAQGEVSCETPYSYTGYIDTPGRRSPSLFKEREKGIFYDVGPRPIGIK